MERPIRFVRVGVLPLVERSRHSRDGYTRLSMVLYAVVRTMDGWFPFPVQATNEMDWFIDYDYPNCLLSVSCTASDGTFLVCSVHSDVIHRALTIMKGHPHIWMSLNQFSGDKWIRSMLVVQRKSEVMH